MREISWDDFYERFFDWTESTRRTRIGDLTGYGSADEVYDIAMELSYDDDRTAARFLGRAAEAGVRFTPEQILEFALIVDEKTLGRMAKAADPAFTVRELEEIEPLLSEADFAAAARKSGLLQPKKAALPKKAARPEKIGFLAKLAAVFAMPGEKKRPARPSGRCSGDCAHCPPHYGYRYGRWYYGHGHQYGCEFGGNKGDGGL